MGTNSLTGADTMEINGRILIDLPNGDVTTITFPNDIASVTIGKNGNAIIALNETGKQTDVVQRVLVGSNDDKALNSILLNYQKDPVGFILMTGTFVKKSGDGQGNVNNTVYALSGGFINKRIEAKSNVEGDTEQSVAIYNMKFTNASRAIT